MLMIRFQRVGKKNEPSFRIVLTEKHRGPQKKYLEELGFYDPRKKTARLKPERISYWLSQGAKVSPSCHNLLISKGVISGSKIHKHKAGIPVVEGDLGIKKGKITVPLAAAGAETGIGAEPEAKMDLSPEVSAEKAEKTEAGPDTEPKKAGA